MDPTRRDSRRRFWAATQAGGGAVGRMRCSRYEALAGGGGRERLTSEAITEATVRAIRRARSAHGTGTRARRMQDIESDTGYDTRRRAPEGALARVSQTQSVFCVAPRRDGAGVRPSDHRRDGRQKTGWTKPQRYPSMGIRSSEAGRGQVSWPGGGPGVGGRSRRWGVGGPPAPVWWMQRAHAS